MAKLIYASNMSLDGWTEDADGGFNWAPPDDDVFVCITEIMRSAGTYLYGRRMYEVMSPWETDPSLASGSELRADFAKVWQAPEKIVYSKTLDAVPTAKTQLVRDFEPDAVRAMKDAATSDLLVGGPHLAAEAFKAGLVDECRLVIWPVILGGRNPALHTDTRVDFELVDEHRFNNGVVHAHYRTLA
jgi:dihydrofolate reductase